MGTLAVDSRLTKSQVYSLVVFIQIFCASLLFAPSIKRSPDVKVEYGANLPGAVVGGVADYLSLLMGFQFVLILAASAADPCAGLPVRGGP